MTIKLLDSSVWIAYFIEFKPRVRQVIESREILLTSAVSLFETKRRLLKHGMLKEEVQAAIDYIKQRSLVTDVNGEL